MGNITTAASAREINKQSSKLINVISRNIKEAAEMGANKELFSFSNLSEDVKESVVKIFKDNGFEVYSYTVDEQIGNDSIDYNEINIPDFCFVDSITTIVIKW